jgi:Ca2+/Na+ antiporter
LARKATELLQPLPMQVQLAPQGEGQKWSEMTEMDRIGQKLQRVIPSLVVLIIYFIYIIIIYISYIYISYIYIYLYLIYIYLIYIYVYM